MSRVFLDSVGLLAVWNGSDQWHPAANAAFAQLNAERQPMVTTSFVLLECGNAAARMPFRAEVDRLRTRFEVAGTLVHPPEEDWHLTWAAYARAEADQAGIVDHVSFVIMRRLGISRAFTNDRHFRAAGFETLF